MTWEIKVVAWDRHKQCKNPVIGISTLPFENIKLTNF
jgi:hypothetical protein